MSFGAEFDRLADLLIDAANEIASGVEGSFADEEDQHAMAKGMRRVERRCRKEAISLRAMADASRKAAS